MTEKEAQKVLDELQGVRPEQLKDEAKRLFEAIMKIADERDKIKQEYDRDIHILQNRLDLVNAENIKKDKQIEQYQKMLATNDMLHIKESQEKDKIIDLMAEDISELTDCPFERKKKYLDCEKMCDVRTDKECWKQYFKDKVNEK